MPDKIYNLESDKQIIIDDYNSGISTIVIAKRYGCNPATIWHFLNKKNVLIRKRKCGYCQLPENSDKVKELYNLGMSAYKIAKQIGVAKCTVLRWLKELGLSTSHLSKQRDELLLIHTDKILNLYNNGESTCKISKKFNTTSPSISRILKNNGIKCRDTHKYTCDYSFFDKIDTQEKAYILGFWYADGNNKKNGEGIRIQICDKEILEQIKDKIGWTGPLLYTSPKKENHKPQYTLSITSRHMSEELTKKGCPPKKTFLIKFPDDSIVPAELINHFIRGYFDGDGSIGCYGVQKKWTIQILGTKEMLDGIILNSDIFEGYSFSQRFPERNNNNYTLHINGICSIQRFIKFIYRDSTIHLSRKKLLCDQFLLEKAE